MRTAMTKIQQLVGSAREWGPLFGARAHDWAETWEGSSGYGHPVYEYVLDRATSVYILIGIGFEEHDLIALLGDYYRR
jgi:hypothetical protein